MSDRYDAQETFDNFLIKGRLDDAYDWAEEALEKKPWSQELKAYLAFSLLILGHVEKAREMAEEVLGVSPYNDWALAVKFACASWGCYRDLLADAEQYLRLDEVWVPRFAALGLDSAFSMLCRSIMLYGSDEQRLRIRTDILGYCHPDNVY